MSTDTEEPELAALPALGQPVASHSPIRCAAVHCGHYPIESKELK